MRVCAIRSLSFSKLSPLSLGYTYIIARLSNCVNFYFKKFCSGG
nr:MAG TPA: hypothetical protein [Caudoviricetes sp.]